MCEKGWGLQRFPGAASAPGRRRLKLAVTPTFARTILIPRLRQFTEAYPEIDLALQVSIPLLDVVAEDADLMVRFGPGHYADVEHIELARDVVTPLASPAFVREHGPFERPEDLEGLPLLRSPLEPWRTWFSVSGLDWAEPSEGSQFNDIGLMCDAALPAWAWPWCASSWARPGWTTARWCACSPSKRPAPTPTTCAGARAPWSAGSVRPLRSGSRPRYKSG
jgi:DNA-binding transcriptional LysR family regulator